MCRLPSSTIVFGGDAPDCVPVLRDSKASIWLKSISCARACPATNIEPREDNAAVTSMSFNILADIKRNSGGNAPNNRWPKARPRVRPHARGSDLPHVREKGRAYETRKAWNDARSRQSLCPGAARQEGGRAALP